MVRLGVEELEDAAEKLQEGHSEQLEADRNDFVVSEMSEQNLKSFLRLDSSKRLYDLFHKVDV